MRQELLGGKTIVCDRYAYSGVAFSAAKGLDLAWCKSPDRGLLRPDLVLFLHLDVDEASRRGAWGKERYEHADFQRAVATKFEELREPDWAYLDATVSADSLAAEIGALTLRRLGAEQGQEQGNVGLIEELHADLWLS